MSPKVDPNDPIRSTHMKPNKRPILTPFGPSWVIKAIVGVWEVISTQTNGSKWRKTLEIWKYTIMIDHSTTMIDHDLKETR